MIYFFSKQDHGDKRWLPMRLQGQYQDKPKLPFIPGSEVSGTVLEVGSKVKHVKPGDKVTMPVLGSQEWLACTAVCVRL